MKPAPIKRGIYPKPIKARDARICLQDVVLIRQLIIDLGGQIESLKNDTEVKDDL